MNPERVIPGQVVSADDDNDAPPQPQETFLHKVASGPLGPVGSGPAGQRAWTDESDATNADDDTEVITAAGAADTRDAEADTTYANADTRDADTAYTHADASDVTTAAADTAGTGPVVMGTVETDTYDTEETDAEVTVVDTTIVDVDEADAAEAGVPAGTGGTRGTGKTRDSRTTVVARDADYGYDADIADEADPAVTETGTDTPPVRVPDGAAPESDEPLLGEAAALVREEWRQVQASFVDDPRASVTAAVGVVADAAARLESLLRERQRSLRGSGDGTGQADTEAMRQLMLTYRGLLTKLIS
jgi:hypothetical protein